MGERVKTIDILGSEWTIELVTDKQWAKHKSLSEDERTRMSVHGICFGYQRKIVVRKNLEKNHRNAVITHEIVHAFQYESGVFYAMSFNWDVENDTEWVARMSSKINKVVNEFLDKSIDS